MAKFDLTKFLQIISLIGPGILMLTPGGDKLAPIVGTVIHAITVAQIQGGTGPEKLARAQAIIADGVAVTNATGKLHLDPAEVAKVADLGITAVIATVHVIQGAKVVPAPAA
jgi:hypothetical protein